MFTCNNYKMVKCFAALERSLVPWIADSEVKFCPLCKKQFNVARRRHHCRLCGGIMCGKCSTFVSVSFSSKSTLSIVDVHVDHLVISIRAFNNKSQQPRKSSCYTSSSEVGFFPPKLEWHTWKVFSKPIDTVGSHTQLVAIPRWTWPLFIQRIVPNITKEQMAKTNYKLLKEQVTKTNYKGKHQKEQYMTLQGTYDKEKT